MAERPPDKITHKTTVTDDGRIFYDTHMEWTVPPPEGVERDWIDDVLLNGAAMNPHEPGRAELVGACTGLTGLGDYCDTCGFHKDEHAQSRGE